MTDKSYRYLELCIDSGIGGQLSLRGKIAGKKKKRKKKKGEKKGIRTDRENRVNQGGATERGGKEKRRIREEREGYPL